MKRRGRERQEELWIATEAQDSQMLGVRQTGCRAANLAHFEFFLCVRAPQDLILDRVL
jgi:hypothetical protein